MSSPIVPVILSGGSGSRLWPLSRTAYPKQFLSLGGDCSLFQQSVARITSLVQAAFRFIGAAKVVPNPKF